jgi:CheY-like chemotaxis protein
MFTILIIEDDADLRNLLIRLLKREKYHILEAGNGRKAIEILGHSKPDLVITDIIMPDEDGIGTINTLRQHYPEIKIIAISGGGRMLSEDYLKIARMLGAHSSFSKPFDSKALLLKIKELLKQK